VAVGLPTFPLALVAVAVLVAVFVGVDVLVDVGVFVGVSEAVGVGVDEAVAVGVGSVSLPELSLPDFDFLQKGRMLVNRLSS
jgi:hypothetical protein